MLRSYVVRAILLIAILGGALYVLIKDDPAVPTGNINEIRVWPEQSEPEK